MLNQSILNDIRDRISLSSFIGERVPLKRAGRNFRGLCPFHTEKTPSFMVSDEKQIFHCFGCGEGGDIFGFVMKYDRLSFPEALESLAKRAGIELPKDKNFNKKRDDKEENKKKWAYRLNELAAEFFRKNLINSTNAKQAREYLQRRGVKDEISTQLFLGFAENKWDSLKSELEKKGVPLQLACELGLLKKRSDGQCYDFFRDRLIFPIFDVHGKVIGFGGRLLGQGDAKYINSADSILYHKGSTLYGLDKALAAIRQKNFAVLVEGNFDLLRLRQAGIENVVAPLGTALTQAHVRLLSRYTKDVVIIFDGDAAGVNAAHRALPIFIEQGLVPRAVGLPDGEDPDSYVVKFGAQSLIEKIESAPTLFEFFIQRVSLNVGKTTSGMIKAFNQIAPIYNKLGDPIEKGVYRKKMAQSFSISEDVVRQRLEGKNLQNGSTDLAGKQKSDDGKNRSAEFAVENLLIEAVVKDPSKAKDVFSRIGFDSFEDERAVRMAMLIKDTLEKNDGEFTIADLLENAQDSELEADVRRLSFGEGWSDEEMEGVISDCIAIIERKDVDKRLDEITTLLKTSTDDENKIFELLKEKNILAKQKNIGE